MSLTYGPGPAGDLAVARLRAGKLVISNQGSKATRVTVSAEGYFTDGSDTHQTGDALHIAETPLPVLTDETIGIDSAVVPTAGQGSIPAATSPVPPSLVLWKAAADHASKNAQLAVDPAGAARSGRPGLTLRKGAGVAGLVLAPPAGDDAVQAYTSAGTAHVSSSAYAWFAGSFVLNPGAHILTGAAAAAIASATAGTVTFTGHPAAISDLVAGDTLVAGITAATPTGLLRLVSSVDEGGADTVVHTTAGALSDVFDQASFSTGSTERAPTPVLPRTPAPRPGKERSATCTPSSSFGVGGGDGGLIHGGAGLTCTLSTSGNGYAASVTAGANASIALAGHIYFGIAPVITTDVDISTSAHVEVSAQISQEVSIEESVDNLPPLPPIVIQIGPAHLILTPQLTASVGISGSVQATLSGSATVTLGVHGTCYAAACTVTPRADASGSGSLSDPESMQVEGFLQAGVNVFIEDSPGGISIQAGPRVGVQADSCQLTFYDTVSVSFGLVLRWWGHTLQGPEFEVPLSHTEFGTTALRNCAIWSGTFNFKSHGNFDNPPFTHDMNGSSSMTIDPVDGHPPTYGDYTLTGSGSGVDLSSTSGWFCGETPNTRVNHDDYHWSGAITDMFGNPVPIKITYGQGRTFFVDLTSANGVVVAIANHTSNGWYDATHDPATCANAESSEDGVQWYQDVFDIFEQGATSSGGKRLTFTVPAHSNTSTGKAAFPQADLPAYTLKWSLTKTCLKGGTECH